MKHHFIFAALVATGLLLGASPSRADEPKVAGEASSKAAPGAKSTPAATSKAKPRKTETKLVDINSASPAELKKLPRIGDLEALKIIDGRPYGSIAWLVTNQILPEGVYMDIKDMIVARLPFKDGDKNVEYLKKAAEKKKAAAGK